MPIITLSRGSKSGGFALAEMLAAKLPGSNLISREVLVKVSEDYGVTEKNLVGAMEEPPHFWERSLGNPRHLYLTFIRAALLDYAARGCMIYHGHAGQFLLSDISWVLKVRLIAPLDQRIRMLQQSMKVDRYDAIQYIKKVDEERSRWTKFLYNEDWADPIHYDIVINLHTISLETACQAIIQLLKSPEFQRTPERTQDLVDKALAARVIAALESNVRTRGSLIQVSAEGTNVSLSGKIAQEGLRPVVVETVKKISGVDSVNDHMFAE